MSIDLSFNHPSFVGKELIYIAEAIQNEHISGGGKFTQLCNAFLEQQLGVAKSIMTTSCTDALEMTALLLNLQPGDEVILPSFTFVSTANAFVLRGAVPHFVDIRPDTLNIDETLIESKITARTKAIVVVHYAGVAAEMDAIMAVAAKYQIPVIEDNAHGLFGRYKNRFLGSIGQMATQSFHETKNFTCGEGGALLLNDKSYIERAEVLKDKGTNRKKFLNKEVDKYTWVDLGSSFILSDILAAFLYAQFEKHDLVQSKRQKTWNTYFELLDPISKGVGISLPFCPPHCDQAHHMFYILCQTKSHRTAIIEHLKENKIQAVFHYSPLHLSPMGQKFGGKIGDCPVSENVSDRILRLPFFNDITSTQLESVAEAFRQIKN